MHEFSLCEYLGDLPSLEILDIGAIGLAGWETCYEGLMRAGRARLTGFEPDPTGLAELSRRYGAPHRFFPSFIGDGRPAKFYQTNISFTSSLFPPNRPVIKLIEGLDEITSLVEVHDVETVRIDDIAEIEDVDFIQIDIQGGELNALAGAERALAAAVLIQTEVEFVEIYEGQPLFADVNAYLCARGFWFVDLIDMGTGVMAPIKSLGSSAGKRGVSQKLWADAIYVKDPRYFDRLSDLKLRKLALLLHDCYDAYDLVHFCLAAADRRRGEMIAPRYADRLGLRLERAATETGGTSRSV